MGMRKRSYRRITSSMEDYLEAIAVLKKEKGVVRVKDISRRMHVRTPSVTGALENLSRRGLVIHERYGYVALTPDGAKLALAVKQRHDILVKFLSEILEIDPDIARQDACKIEHSISPETYEKLSGFIKSMEGEQTP